MLTSPTLQAPMATPPTATLPMAMIPLATLSRPQNPRRVSRMDTSGRPKSRRLLS